MFLKSEDLVNRIKDPSIEGEFLENLASLSRQESFMLINEILGDRNALVRRFGLSLIKKINWNKDELLAFMEKGLLLRHPSEIRYWYEAIAPQLGFELILDLMETYIEKDPDVLQRAWYYLDLMIRSRFENLADRLKLIQTKFREKMDERFGRSINLR
ncbi:MAG: hypothetical protein HC894_08190 [Microcoleus sp. SM1_3_4]|nr:hypothetical protein [Microcoleus sp. SM1_3_4]